MHGNQAVAVGGGIAHALGLATITSCLVENNTALTVGGGGVMLAQWGVMTDSVVQNNTVVGPAPGYGGGGVLGEAGIIKRCIIRDNVVMPGPVGNEGWGGGVNGPAYIQDSIISGNSASMGGAFFGNITNLTALNCTIVNNTAASGGVMRVELLSTPKFVNSIILGNTPDVVFVNHPTSTVTIDDCLLQPGYVGPGSNNFFADPRFVDGPGGDFHLRGDSPCIDRGDPNATPNGVTPGMLDLDGHPRIVYGGPDPGAYEMVDASRDPAAAGSLVNASGTPEPTLFVAGRTGSRTQGDDGDGNAVPHRDPQSDPAPAKGEVRGLRPAAAGALLRRRGPAGRDRLDDVSAVHPAALATAHTLHADRQPPGGGPCVPAPPSAPGKWLSPPIAVPVAVTCTFQGLIEQTPGVVRTTNAVIVDVR